MSNQHLDESTQTKAIASQAPAAMRELTAQELLAIVGGPVILNGGGGSGIVATPPASGSNAG